MAHHSKPWSRVRRGKRLWYVTIAGHQHPLGDDEQAAWDEYHKIMNRIGQGTPEEACRGLEVPLRELFAAYLADTKAKRKHRYFEEQQRRLTHVGKMIGGTTLASEIRRFHLAKVERDMVQAGYSPTTINDTMASLQAVFAWAVRQDIADHNPLVGYRKPARRGRTRTMTRLEWLQLLRVLVNNTPLRIILRCARATGCRPGELRLLRWEHIDFDRGLWVIPVGEHKTGSQQKQPRPRIVPLPKSVLAICRILKAHAGDRPFVFVNKRRKPWTKDTLSMRFRDYRRLAGIEEIGGENLVVYSCRHTFGTRVAREHGILAAAKLLGHTTTRTTEKYVHLDTEDLIELRRKVGG